MEEVVVAKPKAEEAKEVFTQQDYIKMLQRQVIVKEELKRLAEEEKSNKEILDAYIDDENNKDVLKDQRLNRFFRFTNTQGDVFYYKREHRQPVRLQKEEAIKILTRKKLLSKVVTKEVVENFNEKAIDELFAAGEITAQDIKKMYKAESTGYASKVITEEQKAKEEEEAAKIVEKAAKKEAKTAKKKEAAPEEMPMIEQEATPRREKTRGRKK